MTTINRTIIVSEDSRYLTQRVVEVLEGYQDVQDAVAVAQGAASAASDASLQAAEAASNAEMAAEVAIGGARSDLVTRTANGEFDSWSDGASVTAEGLTYTRQSGATAIPDLPGWIPGDSVAVPGHFGITGEGIAPDTGPIVVIGSGQSNMVGLSASSDGVFYSTSGVYMWLGTTDDDPPAWVENPNLQTTTYRIPVGLTLRPTIGNGQQNPALAFAHRLKRMTGRDVYVIVDARGSQSIDNWISSGTSSVRYQSLQMAVAAAMPSIPGSPTKCSYFMWQQGETDAVNGTSAATHLGKLNTLFGQLVGESWWASDTVFLAGESAHEPTNLFQPINEALASFCAAEPRTRSVAKTARLPLAGDNTHYTNKGLSHQGYYRYWDALTALAPDDRWDAFQAWVAPRAIPAGEYAAGGRTLSFSAAPIGAGDIKTRLSGDERTQVSTGLDRFPADAAQVVLTSETNGPDIKPTLLVSHIIDDSSGAAANANVAGIYSYIEQTGKNSNQYPKAIAGTAVNASGGDNDATGVVGYAIKLDVPADGTFAAGVGDAAGTGGVCWQRSQQSGLALGAEFACHMAATPTYANGLSGSGNRSMCVHVTSNSPGGPVWAGLSFDSNGLNSGYYGYYSVINMSRSCFGRGGEGFYPDTVGINFGSNTITGPEKALYLGNANYHLWRTGSTAIRAHGVTFDFENTAGNTPGMRLVTPAASPQGGFFGAYKGATGPDGTTSLTTMGAVLIDSSNYTYLAAYDASGNPMSRAGCSPVSNAFVPMGTSGEMALGGSARLWSQVYAATGTINTSDERQKQDVGGIPDDVLDAWGEVGWCQFRFRDAVDQKGGEARLHSGVIAQRVIEAFARHGLDASDYGLLCYDTWEATPDIVTTERVLTKHAVYEQVLVREAEYDDDGNMVRAPVYENGDLISPEEYEEVTTTTPGIAAGDRYGIRYEEALAMEAAYQRRRADRMEARLAVLEAALIGNETP